MQIYLMNKSQISKELKISIPTIYSLIKKWKINEYFIWKKTWWFRKIAMINKIEIQSLKKYD